MSDSEFRQKLARFEAMMAIADARLMSNPKPVLEDMARRCNRLLKALDDVERALSPDCVYDYWEENMDKASVPSPGNIQGEALIRCNAALKVLREYRLDRLKG